jgi:hypothetical protein
MTDRFITEIVEPDQTVIVRVEEDVVAIEVDFRYPDAESTGHPTWVVLLSPDASGRLGSALIEAAMRARDAR